MRKKKGSKPTFTEPVAAYVCAACRQEAGATAAEFRLHLNEVHGRSVEPDTLMKKGVEFLDGSDFYRNRYRILHGEEVVGEKVEAGPRNPEWAPD